MTSLRGSSGAERPAPRLYYLHHRLVGPLDAFAAEFERIAGLGFTGVLLSPVFEAADGNVFHPSEDRRAAESLAPGLTLSENVRGNADWAGRVGEGIVASRCLKREETPEDLLGSLVFLLAPDSDFMTGQTMVVDGGTTA